MKRLPLLGLCTLLVLGSACSSTPANEPDASRPLPVATVTVAASPLPAVESPAPEPEPTYLTLPYGQAREIARAAIVGLTGRDDFDIGYWGSWLQRRHLRLQKRGYTFDQALDAGAGAMLQAMSSNEVISFWIDRKEQDEMNEELEDSFVTVDCLLYNICD